MEKNHSFYMDKLCRSLMERFLNQFLGVTDTVRPGKELQLGIIPEYPVRADSREANGERYFKEYRLDAFILLFTGKNADDALTVGLEIKDEMGDLLYDVKLPQEATRTDYFFLAVPSELLSCALCVIADQPDEIRANIGLLDLDSGQIVLLGAKTDLQEDDRHRLTVQAYRLALQGHDARAKVQIAQTTGNEPPSFVRFDRHLTNTKYLRQVLEIYSEGYDYRPFRKEVKRKYERFRLSPRFSE